MRCILAAAKSQRLSLLLKKYLHPSQATAEHMGQTSECPTLLHKLQPVRTLTHEGEKVLSPLSKTSSMALTKVLRLSGYEKKEREMCERGEK